MSLNGTQLPRSRMVKCLGVNIDDDLTWREHITLVRKKCFGALANLRRLKNVLPLDLKKKMYNALVLPHLDYCSVVWMECAQELQTKIERVQNYGMRLILSQPPRTPSTVLRSELGWMPLSERRRLSRLALVHRCAKKLGPVYMNNMLVGNDKAGCRMTRGHKKLHLFQPKTELYRRSFSFIGSKEWNLLPATIRNVQSPIVFKRLAFNDQRRTKYSSFCTNFFVY